MLATGLMVSVTVAEALDTAPSVAWYVKVVLMPPVYVNEPSAFSVTPDPESNTAVSVSPSGSASLPRTPCAASTAMSGPMALT